MSASMIDEFAHMAAQIRYDKIDVLDSRELTLVRRSEDIGSDAYTVYNRVQEALINGLFQRRVRNTDKETGEVTVSDWGKASIITSTDEIIRINKEVRQLALRIA